MKIWTQDEILANLTTSKAWVVRAIKQLYPTGAFKDGPDGEFFTSVYHALPRYNDNMTGRQLVRARKNLHAYVDRLEAIANSRLNEAAKSLEPDDEFQAAAEAAAAGQSQYAHELWGMF
jgi:hypothetical protein